MYMLFNIQLSLIPRKVFNIKIINLSRPIVGEVKLPISNSRISNYRSQRKFCLIKFASFMLLL